MNKAAFFAPLLSIAVVVPVWASEPGTTTNRALTLKEVVPTASPLIHSREQNVQARCQLSESKINFRINQAEQSRDKHVSIYNGVKKRLDNLVAKFESKGCDVSTLKNNLTKFDSLIQDFGAAVRDYTGSLQNTRNLQCGDTQGKFVGAAQTARQKLLVVKQKADAVHEFFKTTIQPQLSQKIKECSPSPKPTLKLKTVPSSSPAVSSVKE